MHIYVIAIKLSFIKGCFFRFTSFDVEGSSSCSYDYVAGYEGTNVTRSNLIGKLCGNQVLMCTSISTCHETVIHISVQTGSIPPMLKSIGNSMTLRFRTDSSVAGTGFTAVVSFVYGPQQVEYQESQLYMNVI